MSIDKQKLYDFLFMYQEHMEIAKTNMNIPFKKDELDYVMDLVANDMDPPHKVKMSKEEAVEFATKYLDDRKLDILKIPNDSGRAWNISAEYILEDIIPYIYGDALD